MYVIHTEVAVFGPFNGLQTQKVAIILIEGGASCPPSPPSGHLSKKVPLIMVETWWGRLVYNYSTIGRQLIIGGHTHTYRHARKSQLNDSLQGLVECFLFKGALQLKMFIRKFYILITLVRRHTFE